MRSRGMSKTEWVLEQFTQGLISQEEYDILREYERKVPQRKKFFEKLPRILEKALTKIK